MHFTEQLSSLPPLAVNTERESRGEGTWSQSAGSHWLGAAVTALAVTNHNPCDLAHGPLGPDY